MINKKPLKRWLIASILALISGCLVFFLMHWEKLSFENSYTLSGPSGVFFGDDGKRFLVDGGKKKIVVINEEDQVERVLKGEKEHHGFYYASLICSDIQGNMYVADVVYKGRGTSIESERILQYDAKGNFKAIVFEQHYEYSHAPKQYGNILSMVYRENRLIFSMKNEEGIKVYTQNIADNTYTYDSFKLDKEIVVSDAVVDETTMKPVYITRTGEIYRFTDTKRVAKLYSSEGAIPWRIEWDKGNIYFSRLDKRMICRLDNRGVWEPVMKKDSILYTFDVKDEAILATDYGVLYDEKGKVMETFTYKDTGGKIFLFLLSIVCLISGLYGLERFYRMIFPMFENPSFQKAVLIILVALITTSLVIYLSLSSMFAYIHTNVMKELNLYSEVLVESTDIKKLKQIGSVKDYNNETFIALKSKLDEIIDTAYDNELYYYYIIYAKDSSEEVPVIVGIMDYEDTMTARHPFYDWNENEYTTVMEEGRTIEKSNDESSYGTWSFVLSPIRERDGTIVGIMEIGINTDEIMLKQNRLIREIVLTVFCSIIIMIILMLEVVFYQQFVSRKQKIGEQEIGILTPLRSLIFISFLADSMQDGFIPILVSKRYEPLFGLPKNMLIALPITSQLFMTALFSFIGGHWVMKAGIKKTMLQGFLIQCIGYGVSAWTRDYFGIWLGKSIVGIGMGLIIVSVNTLAAVSKKHGALLFGEINAGILAGVTAGVGIGSVLLSRVSYREVFTVAGGMALVGIVLLLFNPEYYPKPVIKEKKFSISRFFFKKEIFVFLIFALMPFLIALSYREYFFPLYAQEKGMSETNIGYLYLLSGLIVIYIGPTLTNVFTKKLGSRITVLMAAGFMIASTLLFTLFYNLEMAIAGIIILSLAISFGYAAQSTYYASRESVKVFGEGQAMGIYALFDNGGQTMGPLLYGLAISAGYRTGVLIMGIMLLISTLIYGLLTITKGVSHAKV